MIFTVYTYFGRIVSTHAVGDKDTHHSASEAARASLLSFEASTGQPTWVRRD
jgi:hypothetical protein